MRANVCEAMRSHSDRRAREALRRAVVVVVLVVLVVVVVNSISPAWDSARPAATCAAMPRGVEEAAIAVYVRTMRQLGGGLLALQCLYAFFP